MKTTVVPIGLGEYRVSRDKDHVLTCFGLGSCVGIAFYDPTSKIGAMAHVMLPSSALGKPTEDRAKFADTAVPWVLAELEKLGAVRSRLQVKLAGGAQMLAIGKRDSRLDIGARNIEAVHTALTAHRLAPAAEELGGNYGRTMQLMIADGQVVISTIGRGEKII